MPFMPFNILGIWLRGLLAIAVLVGGLYLLRRWYDESHVVELPQVTVTAPAESGGAAPRADDTPPEPVGATANRRVFRFEPGWNRETAFLATALALLTWALAGRWVVHGVSLLTSGATKASGSGSGQGSSAGASGSDPDGPPRAERGGQVQRLRRPDGSEIHVETYGPPDAPPLVFTHGWGADATEWYYVKKHLAGRFRLIVWDEPGLGLSKAPDNHDHSTEKYAADLDAVLGLTGGRPAVIVGHSIGGMIQLTFCRLFREALGTRVAGMVLVHTTFTNPVRTTKQAAIYTALEKPLIIPLLYVTIALWPLVWLMNCLSYLNGSAHRSAHKQSFAGTETPAQCDFVAKFIPKSRPDVLARGMLGMIAYDATATLPTIPIPTLVVIADKDTTTPPEAGQLMGQEIPGAVVATLAPGRHMGLIEQHREFNRVLADFASTCLSARAAGR